MNLLPKYMCQYLETIRVENGVVQHLNYHQKRVEHTLQNRALSLAHYLQPLLLPAYGCYKLRLLYTSQRVLAHTLEIYTPHPIRTLRLVEAPTVQYTRKMADRNCFTTLLKQKNGCDELLITQHNHITDTTFSNVIFYNGKEWITPDTPLLEGTCRARLLNEGRIKAQPIMVADLHRYTHLMLINAMLDFDQQRALPIAEALFR